MIPSIRLYESESQAQDAIRQLREEDLGLGQGSIAIVSGAADAAEPELLAELPSVYRRLIEDNLQRGRTAVLIRPAYGVGARAEAVLDGCDPVDVELPEYKPPQPAPLSDFLGIPTLADMQPRARLIPRPSGPSFGFRLLSNNPAPLSSMLRLKLLSNRPGTTSFGLPLLSRPKRPWNSSFGLPLLKNPSR